MKFQKIVKCVQKLYDRFYEDEVSALGAQLAYYFILSLFPFLIFLMTLVGFSPVSGEEILKMLANVLPDDVFELIQDNVIDMINSQERGLLSFGFVTTLWIASNGMGSVIRGLNKAYDEEEHRPFWQVKGEAVIFTIALVVIIILSFIFLIFGKYVGGYIAIKFGVSQLFYRLWDIFRYVLMIFMISIVFAALYYYTPNRRLTWREVVPGAVLATSGWVLISLGFAYYVNNFNNYSRMYGSIGAVIVLLIWLFLSGIIVLMGGELNATLAFEREGKEKPFKKRY